MLKYLYFCSLFHFYQNKHTMKSLLTFIFSIGFTLICLAQTNRNIDCKATLDLDAIMETEERSHYIFTGSDTTGLNVTITKIKVMDARQEMVKRRDKNCTSPNIDECYISVLEEIPAVTMNLYTLPNTDLTNEYEVRKEKVQVQKRAAGKAEVAIVCEKNRSKTLINKLQAALIQNGYPLTINGKYDQATQLSVTDFQRENKMAFGDLTLETLAALGIK